MFSAGHTTHSKLLAFAAFALIAVGSLLLIFGQAAAKPTAAAGSASGKWTCSMDPQFVLPGPGKCPKCFMDLIPLTNEASGGGKRELILSRDAVAIAGITTGMVESTASTDNTASDATSEPQLSIPVTAVLQNLGRSFVYVETDNDDLISLTMKEIEPGERNGNRLIVLSGVEAGERVAVTGLYRIDSAMQILGKVSLANLPDGELASVDEPDVPIFQPAERSQLDVRQDSNLDLDSWFASYEQVRAALAQDDYAAASEPARKLSTAIAVKPAVNPTGEIADLLVTLEREANSLTDASDLEARRSAFAAMSADMVLLARRFGSPKGGLQLVFCPMAFKGKGAHWLQPVEIVDNPYHGLEMPRCGWLVEKIDDFSPAPDKP